MEGAIGQQPMKVAAMWSCMDRIAAIAMSFWLVV
jgi:hypothetical protein